MPMTTMLVVQLSTIVGPLKGVGRVEKSIIITIIMMAIYAIAFVGCAAAADAVARIQREGWGRTTTKRGTTILIALFQA